MDIHHVERADGHDLRDAALARRSQSVGPRREEPADELVRQLGRREVEDTHEHPARGRCFESTATAPRRMDDDDFVAVLLQPRSRAFDARCRDAEHARRDDRSIDRIDGQHARSNHAGESLRRAREHRATDAVQPRDVRDGVHDQDVARSDEVRDLARRERADQHLRHADGQRAHRSGSDGRARAATEAEDAGETTVRVPLARQHFSSARSECHRLATIRTRSNALECGIRRRENLLTRDVRRNLGTSEATRVDQRDLDSRRAQHAADEVGFPTLGVEGGEQEDAHGLGEDAGRPGSHTMDIRLVHRTAPSSERGVRRKASPV